MKIGLLSDSHGNLQYVKKAGKYLKEKAAVNIIIHLGDDYTDVDILRDLGIEIIKVPGVFSSYYQDTRIPNRIIKNIGGIKVLITHSIEPHSNDLPLDKNPRDIIAQENIKAVFYGHTHIVNIKRISGTVFINPGHLRETDKKGNPATFATVEIKENIILIHIISLASLEEVKTVDFKL